MVFFSQNFIWKQKIVFDPSLRGNFAIRWVSMMGYTEKVKALLQDPRVNPADASSDALFQACHRGNSRVFFFSKNTSFFLKQSKIGGS